MDRKMYWGIAALIVILIAAGGFIYYQWSGVQQLKEEVAQDNKQLEEENKPVAENELPPADPGKKWVPHDDHFHQVPIDAPGVWQGEPHEPIAQPTPARPTQATHPVSTYKGPLTYHKELLETNPAQALRELAKEMNHWSAEYIPDIPPDDLLATEYARVKYLQRYIITTGESPPGVNWDELDRKNYELHLEYRRILGSGVNWQDPNNRINQITKLTWIGMPPPLRWGEDGMALWQ